MTTALLLRDMHARTHACLTRVLDHAATLDPALLDRELDGFAYPTVRLQLHHVFGAEQYWIGVLEGEVRIDSEPGDCPDAAALAAFRERVAGVTAAYLDAGHDLDAVRTVRTWRGDALDLAPRHAVLRVLTHAHHHLGQVQAMLRAQGAPVGGLDLPFAP